MAQKQLQQFEFLGGELDLPFSTEDLMGAGIQLEVGKRQDLRGTLRLGPAQQCPDAGQ